MKYLKHPSKIPEDLAREHKKAQESGRVKKWKNFRTKKPIIESLLVTQNYLCAYCEIELAEGKNELGYHIEHIQPKSIAPSTLTYKFDNLMLSCLKKGGEIKLVNCSTSSISCGHAINKLRNNYNPDLFISPTTENCENYFFYKLEGEVIPAHSLSEYDKKQAEYTIKALNLNCARLVRQRKDIIFEGLEIIDKFKGNQDDIKHFVALELAKINGKHFAFITLRAQYFQGLS